MFGSLKHRIYKILIKSLEPIWQNQNYDFWLMAASPLNLDCDLWLVLCVKVCVSLWIVWDSLFWWKFGYQIYKNSRSIQLLLAVRNCKVVDFIQWFGDRIVTTWGQILTGWRFKITYSVCKIKGFLNKNNRANKDCLYQTL